MQTLINIYFSVKFLPCLFILSLVFSCKQPKRRFSWLFGVLFVPFNTVSGYFLWEFVKTLYASPLFTFYVILCDLAYLVLCVFFNWGCFKCSVFEAVLYSIGGWTLEHLSGAVSIIFGTWWGLTDMIYGQYSWKYTLLTFGMYVVTWLAAYFLFKLLCKEREINLDKKSLIVPIVAVFSIFVILNKEISFGMYESVQLVCYKAYAVACCVLMLCLIFDMFESGKYRLDLDTLEQLEKKNRDQYEISRDTVDIINTKCHDLKKMLASLGSGGLVTPQEIAELQDKISIYDSFIDAQNKTLSLVLSEKSLYCEKNGIRLSVMAYAPRLDFMSKTDIYSLFGNILDNAIEAVIKSEEENKEIFLSVKEVGNMIIVHQSNVFDGELNVKNGEILTRKEDRTQHGYGILSIRRTAEKYGGGVKIKANENLFTLDIMLPLPAAE